SGKSTIGGLLAERLGYIYFDTGVMYRAVTWAAIEQGIAVEDEAAVTGLADRLRIDVIRPTVDDGRQYTILADGQDVTWKIRLPEVDQGVSPVSAYAGVRAALTAQQRRIAQKGDIVMVGRDIGTVVLPDADLKIYLDATLEERAGRRYRETLDRGESVRFEDVLASVRRRDKIDSGRALAPLRAAADAVVIDTTSLGIEEVMERVMSLVDGWHAGE
ncbi:MAG: (d)CMP kinase, partial [Anaerolineae bacterium]